MCLCIQWYDDYIGMDDIRSQQGQEKSAWEISPVFTSHEISNLTVVDQLSLTDEATARSCFTSFVEVLKNVRRG